MVAGLVAQEKALIPTLEEVSGDSFDLDRLKDVTASSYRCTLLWKKVLRIAEVQAVAHHLLRRHHSHGAGSGAAG